MKKVFLGLLCLLPILWGGSAFAGEVCELNAYVDDPDPKGLNVRSAPDAKASVVAVLPLDQNGTIVAVRGSEGSWLQIVSAETIEGRQAFQGKGWVFASMLATDTRSDSREHRLFAKAGAKSPVLAKIAGYQKLKLSGCSGAWPKVQWKGKQGYLSPEDHCPNPVTTCP